MGLISIKCKVLGVDVIKFDMIFIFVNENRCKELINLFYGYWNKIKGRLWFKSGSY